MRERKIKASSNIHEENTFPNHGARGAVLASLVCGVEWPPAARLVLRAALGRDNSQHPASVRSERRAARLGPRAERTVPKGSRAPSYRLICSSWNVESSERPREGGAACLS